MVFPFARTLHFSPQYKTNPLVCVQITDLVHGIFCSGGLLQLQQLWSDWLGPCTVRPLMFSLDLSYII